MAKAKASKKKLSFWQRRRGFATQAVLTLVATYIVASLAIDSGSLIQYFVTFVLLGFAINRVVKIFRR